MNALDVHVHVVIPDLLGEGPWRARLVREGDRAVVEWRGQRVLSAVGALADTRVLLGDLRRAGVDGAVLSPWVSMLPHEEPDPGLAREVCEAWNEGLSRVCAENPGRVWAFGAAPWQDPPTAVRVLEQLRRLPGLVGVEVTATVAGRLLGDDAFAPVWEAAEALGLGVFVHPTARGLGIPALQQYYLWNTVGNPVETAMTAAHLVMSGVLERHPRLVVVLAHGGGALPALRGRLRHAHTFQPQARSRLREDVETSLRRLYYDTVVHDPTLLRQLVEWVGPERVVLGSDYPFDMGLARPVEFVRSAQLAGEAEARLLRGNAVRALGLEVRT
ncbi:MAG: amidohydrolase family protein [Armatimonadota bacterium]|nr:amidohydrolase family protein [Armatimonadota bacterium]MDW8155320.1 amidohydrolase family protein [Armatimonadota bacterium]